MGIGETFDRQIGAWKDWQGEPWGRLRYSVAGANLRRHVERGPWRILDAGAGNGLDSIPLAAEGHKVTLVDLSEGMLDEARRNAEDAGAADRVRLRRADIESLPSLYPAPEFDLVICHNMLQYAEDVPGTLRAICAPLKSGGLLSLMSANRYSEVYKAAIMQSDLEAAQKAIHEPMGEAFGVAVRRFSAEEIIAELESMGCSIVARYGVRCVSDYVADELKRDHDSFARLEELEMSLADKFPYYQVARFFQIIARKSL